MKARTRIALAAFAGVFALAGCDASQYATSASSAASNSEESLLISNSSSEPYIAPSSSSQVSSADSSPETSSIDSSEETSAESQEQTSSEASSAPIIPTYDEEPDSLDGLDVDDMSGLYEAFANPIINYTSAITSYFNEQGLYDYYRHYAHNYVQEKDTLFTAESMYSYPRNESYLSVLNLGYLDLFNNITSFALTGDTVEDRLSSTLVASDLSLVKENDSYRNHVFTLEDLNQSYFEAQGFKRVSAKKYAYERQFVAAKDNDVFGNFIDICAPYLNNEGFYMTFSKVTIEVDPLPEVPLRIRLYAYKTQKSKLVSYHQTEEYPNWYLLFSETLITDIGSTQFYPANALLGK